ncbi:MAG TPA: hypothetical protein VN033_09330 [Vulgatibacter sp.]|nr:hypothetical protein [Vulgatibacter sp.]
MDKWTARAKNLPIWDALVTLGPALDRAEEVARASLSDSTDFSAINRAAPLGSFEDVLAAKEEVDRLRDFSSNAISDLAQALRSGRDQTAKSKRELATLRQAVSAKTAELDALASNHASEFARAQKEFRQSFRKDQIDRDAASEAENEKHRAARNEEFKALVALREDTEQRRTHS